MCNGQLAGQVGKVVKPRLENTNATFREGRRNQGHDTCIPKGVTLLQTCRLSTIDISRATSPHVKTVVHGRDGTWSLSADPVRVGGKSDSFDPVTRYKKFTNSAL